MQSEKTAQEIIDEVLEEMEKPIDWEELKKKVEEEKCVEKKK